MAPNHSRKPLGSLLGPMGSHWGQKMGQNRKKLPFPKIRIFDYSAVIDLGKNSNLRLCRQITLGNPWGPSWGQWGPIGAKKWVNTVKNCHAPKFEFFTTLRSSIWAKNRIYGYDAKSRWGPPRSILVPMGSCWDQKMGQNCKKLPCPKIRILATPRSSIWQKIEFTVMAPNHGRKPLGSILGPMGSHWGQEMGQNRKKLPCPKIRILTTPRSSIWAKNRFDGYGAKSRLGPPRVHFEPIGSHWGQKMGQNRKKLPWPQIRIFDYSAVIDLCKKSNLRLRRQITMGNPWGLSWGQWGAIGPKKWVKTVKNCHAPKFEFLTTPWSSITAKNRIYGYGTKSRWVPPRVHLGVNGVQLGPKNGRKPSKITMPQIRIFDYSAVIDSGKKSNLRFWCQITVGNPWGPSWGQLGPIWAKKWVKTVKNCHAPKFEFLTTPWSSIGAKNRIYGYDAKSRWGPPRVHLRANGVPLGPKKGSKS